MFISDANLESRIFQCMLLVSPVSLHGVCHFPSPFFRIMFNSVPQLHLWVTKFMFSALETSSGVAAFNIWMISFKCSFFFFFLLKKSRDFVETAEGMQKQDTVHNASDISQSVSRIQLLREIFFFSGFWKYRLVAFDAIRVLGLFEHSA